MIRLVKKNKSRPFIVHTDAYSIEVLGTKFNVDAYPETEKFETTLMHGTLVITNRPFSNDNL